MCQTNLLLYPTHYNITNRLRTIEDNSASIPFGLISLQCSSNYRAGRDELSRHLTPRPEQKMHWSTAVPGMKYGKITQLRPSIYGSFVLGCSIHIFNIFKHYQTRHLYCILVSFFPSPRCLNCSSRHF